MLLHNNGHSFIKLSHLISLMKLLRPDSKQSAQGRPDNAPPSSVSQPVRGSQGVAVWCSPTRGGSMLLQGHNSDPEVSRCVPRDTGSVDEQPTRTGTRTTTSSSPHGERSYPKNGNRGHRLSFLITSRQKKPTKERLRTRHRRRPTTCFKGLWRTQQIPFIKRVHGIPAKPFETMANKMATPCSYSAAPLIKGSRAAHQ